MRSVLPAIFVLTVVTLLTFGASILLRQGNKRIWEFPVLDKSAKYLPYAGWFFYLLFGISLTFEWKYILFVGATGLSILVIISLIIVDEQNQQIYSEKAKGIKFAKIQSG